jgi:uncharacterized FAD-dependent dehydrogenase
MVVNLTHALPARRHSALRKELELLDRTIEKLYAYRRILSSPESRTRKVFADLLTFETSESQC